MSRALKDFRLNDRASRTKLAARSKPYWRLISDGRHLGYRSGKTTGSWIVRFREPGSDHEYKTARIGAADDRMAADGDAVLSWPQALAKANEWFVHQSEQSSTSEPVQSIREAVEAYVKIQDARESARAGRPKRSVTSSRMHARVLQNDSFCSIMLDRLTERDLREWLDGIVGIKFTSKKRLCADLKAALNAAFSRDRSALPGNLKLTISEGLKLTVGEEEDLESGRSNQIIDDDTVRTLVAAAFESDADLGRVVLLLAATGARFSQIQRMKVQDVQIDQSRLMIPSSRKGRSRKASYYKVQVGRDVIDALLPVIDGREPHAVLLERWWYTNEGSIRWVRHHRQAWSASSDMTKVWKKLTVAAGAPGTIPYALRHSSIVRGLRNGLPIRLVAALHDTSTEMIERHYSRWITEGLEDLVARAIVPMLRAS